MLSLPTVFVLLFQRSTLPLLWEEIMIKNLKGAFYSQHFLLLPFVDPFMIPLLNVEFFVLLNHIHQSKSCCIWNVNDTFCYHISSGGNKNATFSLSFLCLCPRQSNSNRHKRLFTIISYNFLVFSLLYSSDVLIIQWNYLSFYYITFILCLSLYPKSIGNTVKLLWDYLLSNHFILLYFLCFILRPLDRTVDDIEIIYSRLCTLKVFNRLPPTLIQQICRCSQYEDLDKDVTCKSLYAILKP